MAERSMIRSVGTRVGMFIGLTALAITINPEPQVNPEVGIPTNAPELAQEISEYGPPIAPSVSAIEATREAPYPNAIASVQSAFKQISPRGIDIGGETSDTRITPQKADELNRIATQAITPTRQEPGRYQTSEVMAGDTAVQIVFLESTGANGEPNTHNWSNQSKERAEEEIRSALQFWTDFGKGNVHFIINEPVTAFVSKEPFDNLKDKEGSWVSEAASQIGNTNNLNYFEAMYDVVNQMREQRGTAWAGVLFVVNAEGESEFKGSYAYVNGPFAVLVFNEKVNGKLKDIAAHEWAHIFGALDQYPGSSRCDVLAGYFLIPNANSEEGKPEPCIKDRVNDIMKSLGSYLVSTTTAGEIGLLPGTEGQGLNTKAAGTLLANVHINAQDNKIHVVGDLNIEPAPSGDGKRLLDFNTIEKIWLYHTNGLTEEISVNDGNRDESREEIDTLLNRKVGDSIIKILVRLQIGGQKFVVAQNIGTDKNEDHIWMPFVLRGQESSKTEATIQNKRTTANKKDLHNAIKRGDQTLAYVRLRNKVN